MCWFVSMGWNVSGDTKGNSSPETNYIAVVSFLCVCMCVYECVCVLVGNKLQLQVTCTLQVLHFYQTKFQPVNNKHVRNRWLTSPGGSFLHPQHCQSMLRVKSIIIIPLCLQQDSQSGVVIRIIFHYLLANCFQTLRQQLLSILK